MRIEVPPSLRHTPYHFWVDGLPPAGRVELCLLVMAAVAGGGGVEVVRDWVEEHGGERGWAELVRVVL